MIFAEGQGVLGKIPFVDGKIPMYDRTYLVVSVSPKYIEVLNVFSVSGKERKLFFPTNEQLRSFKPPFMKPSFVKLDSLVKVFDDKWNELTILGSGAMLDTTEFVRIKSLLQH